MVTCKEAFVDIVAVWPFAEGEIDFKVPFNVRTRSVSASDLGVTSVSDLLKDRPYYSVGENYDDFIERVKKNPLAVAVKVNDLTDNMDIRRLPYLSDKDVKRLKKYLKAYKKLIGEPVYSIYAARQEHPNAFDPWTEEADAELRMMWDKGISANEIADHFGRKSSAIITRMKKLGL